MNSTEMNPKESLELINQIVRDAKNRFEENGFAFMLWGSLIALCSFTQYYLITIGRGSQSWYPYLLLPIVSILTMIYYAKKEKGKKNHLSQISSRLWIFTSFNIMITAFAFSPYLKSHLIFVILLLIGIATVVSASFIRSRVLLFSGLVLNVAAYLNFFINWKEQILLMGGISILAILLPGVFLYLKKRKQSV